MSTIGIKGKYHDRLLSNGACVHDSGWRSNRIVNDCNRLLAALMKNEAGMQGLLYLAIGAGQTGWDSTPPATNAGITALANEWTRQAITPEQIVFVDDEGLPSATPTDQLQITVSFDGSALVPSGYQSLREFGLFGGDATEVADSGYLINYVVHPRIDFTPHATLIRELRLQFGVAPLMVNLPLSPQRVSLRGASAPATILSGTPLKQLDGVGEQFSAAFAMAGITTIGGLAETDLTGLDIGIPSTKLVELQAKAVLALRSASSVPAVKALARHQASSVATSPTVNLMTETGASESAVAEARSQAAALQLALNDRLLARTTLEDLTRPAATNASDDASK